MKNPTSSMLIATIAVIFAVMKLSDAKKEVGINKPIIPKNNNEFFGPFIPKNNLMDPNRIYKKYGDIYNVDWKLIKAHAIVESNENPKAINPNDPSYGQMQILCTGPGEKCQNNFFIAGWENATKTKLLDPDFNISLGAQIIAWNQKEFGFKKGIAVYNNWSARNTPDGEKFPNQSYVEKVTNEYNRIKQQST